MNLSKTLFIILLFLCSNLVLGNENTKEITDGFRLYTSYHVGYHFSFK